jgi:Tfp pilus assembly protein PilF
MRFPLACLAAVAAFALAYGNSLQSPFHFDDDHVIARNPHLRDLSAVPRFFTDARTFSVLPQNATYRPLLSATLAVDHRLAGGLAPTAYHLTQLALFLAVGALLFLVTRALLRECVGTTEPWHRWAALGAAALFCLHTGNSQPGNYISARSELLCALGVLGALHVFLTWPRLRPFGLFLVPMVLGALGKTPAVIFAPLLLCWLWLRPRTSVARALLIAAPVFAVAAATFLFVEGMNPQGQTYGGGSRLSYLWTQAWIWVRYVRLFFLPTGLSADTDLGLLPSPWDLRVGAGAVLLVSSLAAAAWLTRRPQWRPAALGIAWFWLGILPTSSIFPLAEVTNDHRMFLGYLGLCLSAGTLTAERLYTLSPNRPRTLLVGAATCAAVLVAHAVGTHLRNRSWQSEEALWADVVHKSPANGRGWMNYGLTKMRAGDLERARALFEHAATLTPNYSVLEVNRAIVHGALGDATAAEHHFRRAQALAPDAATSHFFYGRWLLDRGRGPEALRLLDRAAELDFGDPAPRQLALWLAAARGLDDERRARAQALLRLGPDAQAQALLDGRHPTRPSGDAQGHLSAGFTETGRGHHLAAALSYRAVLAQDPSSADAWNNLGWSLLQLGFVREALGPFERAAALAPQDERPRNNLHAAQLRAAALRH